MNWNRLLLYNCEYRKVLKKEEEGYIYARDSVRKTQGNETVVQGYPVVPTFIKYSERLFHWRCNERKKESRKGHDIIQQDFGIHKNLTREVLIGIKWVTIYDFNTKTISNYFIFRT